MKRLISLTQLTLVAWLFLAMASSAFATITLTGASGGGNILADTAANGSAPAWTTLGAITITEGASTDFTNGTSVTLILKVPAGFQFNTAVTPDIAFIAKKNITNAAVVMTDASTITVTLSVSGTATNGDSLSIGSTTGIQVRPTASLPFAAGNHIYRPSTGGGTAGIRGITNSVDGSDGSNFGTLTEAPGTASATMPSQTQIMSDMVLANHYFTNEWPTAGCSSCLSGSHPSSIWTRATYFEGSLAMWRINHDPAITNYATQWGTFHNWTLRGGATGTSADDQCAGSEFIELYQLNTLLANRITNIVANLNYWMTNSGGTKTDWWWYIDGIHMSMPAFAKMAAISGGSNTNYANKMYSYFHYTKSQLAPSNGLYNLTDHLWCRDSNYLANYKASDGTTTNCYWSRGNGWVFAGLARTLDVLPSSDAHFTNEYLQTFQQMAAALKPVQRSDGFWNMNLAYANDFPGPESSGTAMFVYGLAWGIHHGYLNAATYLPTVIKGWNAMATSALHHSPSTDPGFIGYVQSTGSYPTNSPTMVTYTSPPDFDDFTLGALLLAGSEVYQLTNLSQTITFAAPASHNYGDAPITLSASASSGLSASFSILSGPASLAGNTLTITGAGTVTVRASQAGNTTYAATNVDLSFTVSPALLTVTAQDKSRNYGASNPSFTASYNGFVNGDTAAVLTGSPGLTTGATTSSPIGSYAITAAVGTLGAANYNFTFVNGSLTVNPAALTVSADPKGKVYGDADPVFTWQISGGALVSGDAVSGLLSRVTGAHVGSYAIQRGTLTAGTNYTLSYVGANMVINPKAITVTADSKSKIYGDTDPTLTCQVTSGGGLVPGDSFAGSLARVAGENVGSYAITQNSLTAGTDYNLAFVGANLAITKRDLMAQADDKGRAYGQTNPIFTITYTGFAGTDGITNLAELPQAGTIAETNSPIGTYDIAVSGGSDTNYSLVLSNGTLTVTTAALTVSADPQSKTYGESDPALTWQMTGGALVGSDKVSGLLSRDTGEQVGSFAIQEGTLSAGTNYTLSYVGTNLVINAKAITVTADNKIKTQGLANPPLTARYDGFVNGENTNALTKQVILSTAADSNSPAGTAYPITVSGAAAANYTFSYVDGVLTVVARPDLTGIRTSGNQSALTWPTIVGQNYQVEYKDNLDDTVWTPLGNPVAGTGDPLNVNYDNNNAPHQFYRLKIIQP